MLASSHQADDNYDIKSLDSSPELLWGISFEACNIAVQATFDVVGKFKMIDSLIESSNEHP